MIAQPVLREEKEPRSGLRIRLCLSATIRFGALSAAIRLRDLSTTGARIEGESLPSVGASALITRGALNASGTIVWRDRKGCGVRFENPLSLEAWMPAAAGRDQLAVDAMVEQAKSGRTDLPPEPQTRSPQSLVDALPQRLAEELAYVGRLLESLGDDLCGEPLVVMRHSEKLQNLDIAAQILGHVAGLLVAERPDQAVDAIGMTSLRKRLLRTTL